MITNYDKYEYKYHKYKDKYLDLVNDLDINSIIDVDQSFGKKIFFNWKDVNCDKIIYTKDSIYSSSRAKGSKRLIDVIKKHVDTNDVVITDATANIGTDTINLASEFSKINAIELSNINFKALKNNVNVFGLQDKINVYHGDSNKVIKNTTQDIIYVDAPWGGPDYKQSEKIRLYLGDVEIMDFYLDNKDRVNFFIFKVPNNYDFEHLYNKVKDEKHKYSFRKGDKVKYYLIVITPKKKI